MSEMYMEYDIRSTRIYVQFGHCNWLHAVQPEKKSALLYFQKYVS